MTHPANDTPDAPGIYHVVVSYEAGTLLDAETMCGLPVDDTTGNPNMDADMCPDCVAAIHAAARQR